MNRKAIVVKNSFIGLLSQAVTIVFSFITRSLFIQYIGVEVLGINSTFTSVLNALSLSELGFESAVVYSLYRPMHDDDTEKINDIINILKVIYRYIGGIFIVASIILLPFLKYVLAEITLPSSVIYVYFLLQSSASICTYFLSYKRTLLYADQKEYISKMIDTTVGILFNIGQCISLVVFQSYIIYLLLKLGQTFVSNIIVHIYCVRYYPYLHKSRINKNIFKEIVKNVKNIFVGRVAGFVYASTDSIVISAFINTVSVGYYGNYTTIVYSLRNLTNGLLTPIMPIVGNYLVEENNSKEQKKLFLLYTHVRFWIALLLLCPVIVLVDTFIKMWIGEGYILPSVITYLLVADLYIHLVHSSTVDYINGFGLFKLDKYIGLVGAISNVISSVIFVQFLGMAGVIVGTILSQSLFWIGRSWLVYFRGLRLEKKQYLFYWLRNAYYVIVFLIGTRVSLYLYACLNVEQIGAKFIIGGIITEICVITIGIVMLGGLKEQKKIVHLIKSTISGLAKR